MLRWVCLIALCMGAIAQMDLLELSRNKRGNQKYCGRDLADALQLMCNGIYNQMFPKKKSYSISELEDTEGPFIQEDDEPRLPFNPKHRAVSLIPNILVRHTRGVHDECCRKSCSSSELATYCGRR